jgi:hypothetical protein
MYWTALLVAAKKASVVDESVNMEYWRIKTVGLRHFACSKLKEDLAGNEYGGLWWEMVSNCLRHSTGKYMFEHVRIFSKLLKETITFVMSVCLSACLFLHPSARNNSAPTGRNLVKFDLRELFWKNIEKIEFSLKSDKNDVRVLHMKTDIHLWSYLAHYCLEWEMLQTTVLMWSQV